MTTMNKEKLWSECLDEIELNLSKANFSTWFKNTNILKEEEGIVHIGVPNEFVKDWLFNKYHSLITKTVGDIFHKMRSVEYVIYKIDIKNKQQNLAEESKLLTTSTLPLNDLYINKEDNLNARYTFDSFVVGPFNELAQAAAQAIVKSPGMSYNPFFIYGGTGLGKTHLIQAIGNAIKEKHDGKKILYITLEKFAVDYVTSLQKNKPNVFKEKYRKYDVIIMDDIQFVSNKEKTQEELFHLFNTLYENNKQIIFSSDKHPNYMPGLEDRLKSRFAAGMIVDINEPEFESRLAILKSKLLQNEIILPDEIIQYVASAIQGNVRELEGSLNSVICQTQLKNRDLTLNEVKTLIKNSIQPKKNVSIAEIVKVISGFYNIEEASIYEKTRRKEIVKARQLVMYILREDFNVSYPLIGQKLGGKDHTTVIHSCLKIKKDLKVDTSLTQEVEQLRAMLK
ncbi:chromosomal replication initiator protein DnaA [Candidatus Wolfebacteria bacterium]|nr:MAG: chromosomal replication initiator protein DnaA [Candidatus Wolfebacteria bacterium]